MASAARWLSLTSFAAVIALGVLGGCDGAQVPHTDPETAFRSLERGQPDEVVARVGDRAISLEEFEAFWHKRPELDRDQALDAIIDRERLVAAALDRGLLSAEEMQLARKRAMVRLLLRDRIEREITAEQLSEDDIAKTAEEMRIELGHPAGLRASHILVMIAPDQKKAASKEQLDQWGDQARRWIDAIRAELPERPSALDLFEARDRFADELPEPLQVVVNAHLPFPIGEAKVAPSKLPEGWAPVVEAFREAAVEQVRQGDIGRASEPVESKFGWHVLVVEQTLAGQRPDAEALRETATEHLLQKKRNARLVELLEAWIGEADAEIFPEIISQAEEVVQE